MQHYIDLFEHELTEAVEVKNADSLHRAVTILSDNIIPRSAYENDYGDLSGSIKVLAAKMEQGFAFMDKRFEDMNKRFEDIDKRFEDIDKRFEDMNKRFEDMNKRFTMMFAFITFGISLLSAIAVIFEFIT